VNELTIGQAARQAGVAPSAIRYYERIGLLPEPDRVSGRRTYEPSILRRLAIIDTGKRAGLTLDEIRTLLDSHPAHEQMRALATAKLGDVEAMIEQAQAMRDWLLLAQGCTCPSVDDCALFGG
jgi:DNA-binding transcriptional MerR regulator